MERDKNLNGEETLDAGSRCKKNLRYLSHEPWAVDAFTA